MVQIVQRLSVRFFGSNYSNPFSVKIVAEFFLCVALLKGILQGVGLKKLRYYRNLNSWHDNCFIACGIVSGGIKDEQLLQNYVAAAVYASLYSRSGRRSDA
jgi:hypothetical protein